MFRLLRFAIKNYQYAVMGYSLFKAAKSKFNDHLAFENTGDRIELDKIVYQDWIEDAKDMREKGLSYRMISERLKEDGYNVSKSVLQRKLS